MPILHTAETLGVDCPNCGTPITGYHVESGVQITVPGAGPNGGPGTLLGAGDEVDETAWTWGGEVKPAPDFNRITLQPCGHTLRGHSGGNELLQKIRDVHDARQASQAEATLAEHRDLLDAVERAGHAAVVDVYRRAVWSRSTDAQGLLVALKALAGR